MWRPLAHLCSSRLVVVLVLAVVVNKQINHADMQMQFESFFHYEKCQETGTKVLTQNNTFNNVSITFDVH